MNIFQNILDEQSNTTTKKPKPKKKPSPKKKPKPVKSKPKKEKPIYIPPDEPEDIDDDGEEDVDDEDLNQLIQRSTKAKLMQEIRKEELQWYEIEKKRIELDRKAGNIMEKEFGEFLFFGYIEKINIDMISMTKKLLGKIESAVQERDSKTVVKLIEREVKATLKEIKKAQIKDMKTWNRER